MRYEDHNLDGTGYRRTQVYDMPVHITHQPASDGAWKQPAEDYADYWPAVTDVPCPAVGCSGHVQWAEAGYVAGYRICDSCGRHFRASGNAEAPALLRVGSRRGGWYFRQLKAARAVETVTTEGGAQ